MKVCRSSVKAADKVKKQGVPQRVDALAAGKVSVRSENLPQTEPGCNPRLTPLAQKNAPGRQFANVNK